jgi:hypothetical protein
MELDTRDQSTLDASLVNFCTPHARPGPSRTKTRDHTRPGTTETGPGPRSGPSPLQHSFPKHGIHHCTKIQTL